MSVSIRLALRSYIYCWTLFRRISSYLKFEHQGCDQLQMLLTYFQVADFDAVTFEVFGTAVHDLLQFI